MRHFAGEVLDFLAPDMGVGFCGIHFPGFLEQALVVFHAQQPPARVGEPLFGELSALNGALDAEEALGAGLVVGLEEDGVHAGLDRHGARLRKRPFLQDGGHADGIGNDHAFEAHFAPQKIGEDFGRQGGGELFVEGRVDRMRRHKGLGARIDARLEGDQLDLAHPLQVPPADVQHVVRVGRRIAAAGEVLDRGDNARVLVAAHRRFYELRADLRIIAEGAHADFGVERIDINVADGVIELGYADEGHLFAERIRHLVGQIEVSDGSHAHRRRELHDVTGRVIVFEIAFHVDGDVQGDTRGPFHRDFLQLVERDGELFRRHAHAEAAIVEVGMRDVEPVLRLLEVGVNLRTSPIQVLAGFQRVWFEAKATGVQFGDLFDPRGRQVGAPPGEGENLAALFRQGHFRQLCCYKTISFFRHGC